MTIDALGTKGGAARGYKRIDVFYDISGIISPQSCGNQNLGLVGLVDWSLEPLLLDVGLITYWALFDDVKLRSLDSSVCIT